MTGPARGWSGAGRGWRYLAQKIDGSGNPGEWLDTELPLRDVTITDALSGPAQLTGTLSPVVKNKLTDAGGPLFNEWGTVIHAENDGSIRGSYILVGSSFSSEKWSLDCIGFTGYAKGMAYDGVLSFVGSDPLDVVRHIWEKIQTTQFSNLGMVVDETTTTDALVGIDPADAAAGSGETRFLLSWWDTHDMGGKIDELAASTPFDYRERHVWNADRTQVLHYLDFGYPAIGRRRDDLRFVLGENIQVMLNPQRDGEDFANHVRLLGAGEGSEMVMAEAQRRDGRLRRMAVVDDKGITDKPMASLGARLELARRNQLTQINDVMVRNTPSAPLGAFGIGDEIRIAGQLDWMSIDMWCRITGLTITPDNPDVMALKVVRSDLLSGADDGYLVQAEDGSWVPPSYYNPPNPNAWDFEDGVGLPITGINWNAAPSPDRAHSGTRSLKAVRANPTQGNGFVLTNNYPVTPNNTYVFSVWTFAQVGSKYSLSVGAANASQVGLAARLSESFFTPSVNVWQKQEVTFTVPPGVAFAHLYVTDDPNSRPIPGTTIYLDDIVLERVLS